MDPVQSTSAPAPSTPTPAVTPDPTHADPITTPAASTTPAATPTVPSTPAPAASTTPAATTPEAKTLLIPSNAMKKIKAEEREKGRTDTLSQLDTEAQGLGFANHAEMKAFAQAQKQAAATGQPPPADPSAVDQQQKPKKPAVDPEAQATQELKAQRDKALEDQKRLNRANARAERENKKLKQQLIEQEVQTDLKLAAKDAGVVDCDYAVEVLKRSIKGMSEAELQSFDEGKFFREDLRTTHPHLYQVEARPVTTGTGNTPTAKPTQPSKTVDPDAPKNGRVDATKLSGPDFQALLRKRGLSDPTTGGMLA